MKVSELARRAGVNASAVRFYEEVGVLPPATRRANGYPDYGGDVRIEDVHLARERVVRTVREPHKFGVSRQA